MKTKSALRSFLTIAGSSLLAISYSHAADGYWNVNANGSWGLNTNWLSNNIADGTGSTAYFTNDITADRTVSLDGDRTLTGLVFGDRATGTAGSWILDNGGTSTNNLILAGTTPGITVNALGTNKTATISAIIEGTDGLVKRGIGTLVLTGANTYTGTTTINQGTLTLNSFTGSLNTTTPLTFSGTGTFNMDNVGAGGNLSQTLGALTFSAGQGTVQTTRTAAFDQAITFNSLSARTAGASGNFVNTGTNSATNGFIIATGAPAAGTLIDRGIFYNGADYASYDSGGFIRAYGSDDVGVYLAAPAGTTIGSSTATRNVDLTTGNITAQTTISANTLNMRNRNLTLSTTAQVLSVNGILSSGSATAAIATAGKLEATAAGNEIVIRVNGGSDVLTITPAIRNFGVNSGGTASALTKTGAGKLVIGTAHTLTGAINVNAGTLEYNISIGSANNYTIGSGATLSTNGGGTFSGTILNNGSISKGGNQTATFSGDISGTGSFSTTTPITAGTLTLSGNNTFSGGLTVAGTNGSSFNINSNGALGTGTFTYNEVQTFNINVTNWVNSNNNPIVLNNTFYGKTIGGSYSTADFGTGAVTLSGGNQTITNNGTTVTFGGAIGQDVAGRGLAKAGTGTLVLSGTNTYTGVTTLTAGTLSVATIGDGSVAGGLGQAAATATNIVFNGGTLKYTGADATSNRAFTINATKTATIDTTNNISFAGATGTTTTGALTKTGAGKLTLTGNSTYTGVTTLTAGTLSVASINNGGVAGGLGQAAVAATNIVFNGGTLQYTGISATSNRAFTINADKTATIETTNDISFAGATGTTTNGALTKTGGGKLTLTGTNTYTGTTTITGGTLALGASGSIASSPTIIVGATTTFDVSAVSGYTLGASQTLSGTGAVVGAMTVAGTLSPGNSPGIMPTVGQTWVNDADYNVQMLDATGTAGTGFDQIQVTGTLDLTGLTTGGFDINLWSLSSVGPDVNGNALNFNNTIDQSWTILTTTGGISGFDPLDFTVNVGAFNGTDGFDNALGGGSFFMSNVSNNLVLNFDAIPEPNVAALIGGFGVLTLLRRRRA